MLQSFLMGYGLDAGDAEMLCILGAACTPSFIALLLALFAHWLPDSGHVPAQHRDDREHAHDDDGDWRRAA